MSKLTKVIINRADFDLACGVYARDRNGEDNQGKEVGTEFDTECYEAAEVMELKSEKLAKISNRKSI